MAEIDLKDTLERFAAEGTRGAGAPPLAAVRRRRRNRSIRRATALTVLAVALVAVTPPLWGLLRDSDDPVAPAGGQRSPTPAPAPGATRTPLASKAAPTTTTDPNTEGEGGQTEADAKATAAYFARFELGFNQPVAGRFLQTQTTWSVEVRPTLTGESTGQPGPVTLVSLRPEGNVWIVTGAHTAEIDVTGPKPYATVASPVAVRGSAVAFEGTVQVEVKANLTGKDPVLGRGFVTGGGDVKRPFQGSIAYHGGGPGWLVFFTDSEANGQVLEATVIPVDLG